MVTHTRTRKVSPKSPRPKARDPQRFQRSVLPPHARVPVDLAFGTRAERSVEVHITDFSPAHIGLVAVGMPQGGLPALRRRVELSLPDGHVLQGIVSGKSGFDEKGQPHHHIDIALRAAGRTFAEIAQRPPDQVLDLSEGLHEVLACQIDASLPLLAGTTQLEGALTAVGHDCATVNFAFPHPGLFLGLEVSLVTHLADGKSALKAEISDIVATQAGGVDILLTFEAKPVRFLAAFARFYARQRVALMKRRLEDELTRSGFLPG